MPASYCADAFSRNCGRGTTAIRLGPDGIGCVGLRQGAGDRAGSSRAVPHFRHRNRHIFALIPFSAGIGMGARMGGGSHASDIQSFTRGNEREPGAFSLWHFDRRPGTFWRSVGRGHRRHHRRAGGIGRNRRVMGRIGRRGDRHADLAGHDQSGSAGVESLGILIRAAAQICPQIRCPHR